MSRTFPLTGWMLDAIVEYDVQFPGSAGRYLRASNERRQVLAALFSTGLQVDRVHGDLTQAGHRSILRLAFRNVPPGMRRALAKCGPQPHEPSFYQSLLAALSCGKSHIVNAIKHAKTLDQERLDIIHALPEELCDIRVVGRIDDLQQAKDLIAFIALFVARGGDRAEVVGALLNSQRPLRDFLRRWALRIPFPTHPIAETDRYRPIVDGEELRRAALLYRNCARRYIPGAAAGESAFGEYHGPGDVSVLLCFEWAEGHWELEDVYGFRNRPLAEEVKKAARAFARERGVRDRWSDDNERDGIGRTLRRLLQPYQPW